MGHLATAEAQGDLHLVAVLQEADHVAQLDVVVAVVRLRAELHFLDLNDLLAGLGLGSTLLFLVAELAVVHQPADRRGGVGRDLDQVDIGLFGHAACLTQPEDTQLLVLYAQQANLGGVDFTVDAVVAFGSDADYLRMNWTKAGSRLPAQGR